MGVLVLLIQCVAMFAASLLVGSLPLMFKSAASGKRLKAISVFGMGILVGAALTIIIPEGVSTLYEALPASAEEGANMAIGFSLLAGFALMLCMESLTPHPPHDPSEVTPTPDDETSPLQSPARRNSDDRSRPLPPHLDSSTPMIPKRLHMDDSSHKVDTLFHSPNGHRGLNATLGMVIHGIADGIALGASSLSARKSLGLIVFLAVLVHKGPTALGLTTTLLSLSLHPSLIRRCLIIFSCAAPIGSLITYGLVSLFGHQSSHGKSSSVDRLGWWTGISLLFSGGSFLYVATVIQPLSEPHDHGHDHGHGHGESQRDNGDPTIGKYTRTALLISGMLLPVILSTVVGGGDH
ncbi:Zinc/iron permease [Kockovaella imperatae]|uniref:Zinc/iron permease n=1 Tax=Kockovaella imperatae TaxID=4999 RepID=A0A1Y1UKI8_9TREE|nr:Zinc/iron permease [Kockovaella imperatae]ORX38492.1 Zinc/iron permease [Kockovaella imperatae]